MYSSFLSGSDYKCLFCNSDQDGKTDYEHIEEIMKRVAPNDAASIYVLATSYFLGNYKGNLNYAFRLQISVIVMCVFIWVERQQIDS